MPIPAGSGFPYQKGLTIQLEDVKLYTRSSGSSPSGSRASLRVTIEELYEPPSRACVLLVSSLEAKDIGGAHDLPSLAILKVVDRRFQGERLKDARRGWSLDKERLTRLRWAGLPGGDSELKEKHYPYLDGDKGRHWRGLCGEMEPEQAEAYFQISTRGLYERELRAYERLAKLRGYAIPDLHAAGRVSADNFLAKATRQSGQLPEMRPEYYPHAVLIEYIPDAQTADRFGLGRLHRSHPEQSAALRNALREMHELGVVHTDIKPDNLLLGRDRAVLLDFGYAKRREDVSEFEKEAKDESRRLDEILGGL